MTKKIAPEKLRRTRGAPLGPCVTQARLTDEQSAAIDVARATTGQTRSEWTRDAVIAALERAAKKDPKKII